MEILDSLEKLNNWKDKIKNSNVSVGFIPTMGALHKGHLSLVNKSKQENNLTLVSIFVNPTQFNNLSDLIKYPKTLTKDINLLEEINCDALYIPTESMIYPQGLVKNKYFFNGLDKVMEGKFREGHFDGVAEVVLRLFNQINPNKAYFGEKDYQQLKIIQYITKEFNLNIDIIPCEILREKSGLAMSSRNERLTNPEKEESSKIYFLLSKIPELIKEKSIDYIKIYVKEYFSNTALKLEYFEICDQENLTSVSIIEKNKKYRVFIAVFCSEIRLIDNIELDARFNF